MWIIVPTNPFAATARADASDGIFDDLAEIDLPLPLKIFAVLLGVIIGGLVVFLAVLVIVWIWLYAFTGLAKYDYVTTSSILFCMLVIPVYFRTLIGLALEFNLLTILTSIIALIVYPIFIAASLSAFELAWQPAFSDQLNIVETFRQVPQYLSSSVSNFLPFTSSTVGYLDTHPTALALASSTVSFGAGLAMRMFRFKRVGLRK